MIKIESMMNKYIISNSFYENAINKYEALCKLLLNKGIDCHIYPQGSFSYGVVVKPFYGGKEQNYDLDIICEINDMPKETNPLLIMDRLEYILNDSIYKEKYVKHDNGFTIKYAEIGGIDFTIDLIPALPEKESTKDDIKMHSEVGEFAANSIIIPQMVKQRYKYIKNNPLGFKQWFDRINSPYTYLAKLNYYNENRSNYSNIEEIPTYYVLSNLQKLIILLKRIRDVYFDRTKNKKPISGLLTVLVCKAVNEIGVISDFDCLLKQVIEYIKTLEYNFDITSLHKENGQWFLKNPVNYLDNLADSWDDNDAKSFFEFIKFIDNKIISNCSFNQNTFFSMIGIEKDKNSYESVSVNTKPWLEKM